MFSEPRSFVVRCGGLCSPFPRLALSVDRPGRRSCGILGGSCCPKVAGVASLVAEMHDAPMAAASADARAETRALPFVDTGSVRVLLPSLVLRCVWLVGVGVLSLTNRGTAELVLDEVNPADGWVSDEHLSSCPRLLSGVVGLTRSGACARCRYRTCSCRSTSLQTRR